MQGETATETAEIILIKEYIVFKTLYKQMWEVTWKSQILGN